MFFKFCEWAGPNTTRREPRIFRDRGKIQKSLKITFWEMLFNQLVRAAE